LAEINNADAFWHSLGQALAKSGECSDVEGLYDLLPTGLYARMVDWLDTGNKDQFDQAVQILGGSGVHLPKEEEDLYFHDKRVIKFFLDQQKVQQRVERARLLDSLVPTMLGSSPNYYSYEWVEGQMLSNVLTPALIQSFLDWGLKTLWLKREELSTGRIIELGRHFYLKKTLERLKLLFTSGWVQDRDYTINGVPCRRPSELLKALDDEFFASARMGQFHGDLHPDNIIVNDDHSGFRLLDWRENYAGLLDQGDMYYDVAKLYHGLLVSHEFVKEDKLLVDIQDDVINIDIPVHYRNLDAISVLERWAEAQGLSIRRLRIIVALIYLNIAPLHHFPYIQFLYFLGNQLLERELGATAARTPEAKL